jgi:predicted RNA-binding protein (virulence factor B family)
LQISLLLVTLEKSYEARRLNVKQVYFFSSTYKLTSIQISQIMLQVGRFNKLKVVKEVPFGLYLDSSKGEILLPKKYIPPHTKVGDELDVFIYTDSEDRLIATTLIPKAQVGDFACLEVVQVTPFGAFLDWGLEKDLFVPLKEQHRKMLLGKKYVVKVVLDQRTERVIGVGKIGAFLEKKYIDLEEGEEVQLFVYEETDLGFMCIINNKYAGILYRNEVFKKLDVGEVIVGYIKKIREDQKIDLSLRKGGFSGVQHEQQIIIDKLEQADGFLPYNDDSSPEDIKRIFQMSKKTFKQLIGNLYKQKVILLEERGIRLVGEG